MPNENQKIRNISASADGGPRSRVLRTLEPLLSPPSTLAEIFRHTFLQSHLQNFQKNLKKTKNRPQGARGGGGVKFFFTQIFIIFF